VESWADGPLRVFDRNGGLLRTFAPPAAVPQLPAGQSVLRLQSTGPAPAKLTLITLGEPLSF